MRRACINMVLELARRDERVCFIGSDLGYGVLDEFRREIPERFLMEGVSEANIIGIAAGLALEGKIPYVNTIGTFITRRPFEQIAVDVCFHRANVRLIGSGGGLVYAAQGPTHMAVEDIAIMRALPNMTVIAPADTPEMIDAMSLSLDWEGPIYIRIARGGEETVTAGVAPMSIGKARELKRGDEVCFVTTGVGAQIAFEAAGKIEREGRSAGILHFPTIKPFDTEALVQSAQRVRAIVVVEEHVPHGGVASAAAEALVGANLERLPRFQRLGLPDIFPDDYGTQQDLMIKYGISSDRAAQIAIELLSRC